MKRKTFKFLKTKTVFFSKFGEIKRGHTFLSNLMKKYFFYILSKKGS